MYCVNTKSFESHAFFYTRGLSGMKCYLFYAKQTLAGVITFVLTLTCITNALSTENKKGHRDTFTKTTPPSFGWGFIFRQGMNGAIGTGHPSLSSPKTTTLTFIQTELAQKKAEMAIYHK